MHHCKCTQTHTHTRTRTSTKLKLKWKLVSRRSLFCWLFLPFTALRCASFVEWKCVPLNWFRFFISSRPLLLWVNRIEFFFIEGRKNEIQSKLAFYCVPFHHKLYFFSLPLSLYAFSFWTALIRLTMKMFISRANHSLK